MRGKSGKRRGKGERRGREEESKAERREKRGVMMGGESRGRRVRQRERGG